MSQQTAKFQHFVPLLILIIVAAFFSFNPQNKLSAQTSNNCSSSGTGSFNIVVDTGSILNPGPHTLGLNTTSTSIKSVEFSLDGTAILGLGHQAGTNPYWTMTWFTQVSPAGPHYVGANVTLANNSTCSVAAIPVTINNTTNSTSQLYILATPAIGFNGLTNEAIDFNLREYFGSASGTDITSWTSFEKKPQTLGAISPQDSGNVFHFSAGPNAGQGIIQVVGHYGGVSTTLNIPIKINAQVPIPSTTGTNTGGTTNQTTTSPVSSTQSQPTATSNPTASIEADPTVKNCIVSKITAERYLAISSGQSRPTPAEFLAMDQCFASRNFVLPSSFVPVAPNDVKSQTQSNDIQINKAVNDDIKTQDGSSTTALKFSGKAKPNSTILIYVFSEPLVLSASTDSNGDWSYSLQDPLQPGKHEAYAVVDKGDGSYERSSVFDFVIGKAEASPANPNGYSLKIDSYKPTASENNRNTNIFISAVLALMALMAGVYAFILVLNRHRGAKALQTSTPIINTPISPTALDTDNYRSDSGNQTIEPGGVDDTGQAK